MIRIMIGSLMTIPYMVLFYTIWIIAQLYHPIKYACWFLMICIHYEATIHKCWLIRNAFLFMFTCKDKKWKLPPPLDPNIQRCIHQQLEQINILHKNNQQQQPTQNTQQQQSLPSSSSSSSQQQQQQDQSSTTATAAGLATTTTTVESSSLSSSLSSSSSSSPQTQTTTTTTTVVPTTATTTGETTTNATTTMDNDNNSSTAPEPPPPPPEAPPAAAITTTTPVASETVASEAETEMATITPTTTDTVEPTTSTTTSTSHTHSKDTPPQNTSNATAPPPATTTTTVPETTSTSTSASAAGTAVAPQSSTTTSTTSIDKNKTMTIETKSKTIIFLRHGESTWNDTFNKGADRTKLQFVLWFIPNLIKAIAVELYFIVTGKPTDSWFYDAPLSPHGIHQAETVRSYLLRQQQQQQQQQQQTNTPHTTLEDHYIRLMLGIPATNTTNTTTTTNANTITHKNKNKDSIPMTTKTTTMERAPLISSNLRRAVMTMAIVLQDRLDQNNRSNHSQPPPPPQQQQSPLKTTASSKTKQTTPNKNANPTNDNTNTTTNDNNDTDEIVMLTCLQEISINPDALAITPSDETKMKSSFTDPCHIRDKISSWVNTLYHDGNKSIDSNGKQRMEQFVQLIFNDHRLQPPKLLSKKSSQSASFKSKRLLPSRITDASNLVVVGHSLWFKSFFQLFLPRDNQHICKRKKLVNCGCVGFTIHQHTITTTTTMTNNKNKTTTTIVYQIDPSTLKVFYGGFK